MGRDHINKNKKGNSRTEVLIRQRIAELMQVWGGDYRTKYPCRCAGTTSKHDLSCCSVISSSSSREPCWCLDGETSSVDCCENANNFLPDTLTKLFDEIQAENVVRSIIEVGLLLFGHCVPMPRSLCCRRPQPWAIPFVKLGTVLCDAACTLQRLSQEAVG